MIDYWMDVIVWAVLTIAGIGGFCIALGLLWGLLFG